MGGAIYKKGCRYGERLRVMVGGEILGHTRVDEVFVVRGDPSFTF